MTAIKKLPQSTVELRGEIATELFESYRAPALAKLAQEVKLPGFRPGHIPNEVLTRELGEETVLRRMAELALNQHYPKLLAENKIDALGRPSISITKIAAGNPLGFIITTAIYPEIILPDYRKLAREALVDGKKGSPSPEGEPLAPEIVTDEESKARDKRRLQIIEKIISATPIDLPTILINSELETMLAEMKHEVSKMGLPFDQYLTHLKKTELELKKEWESPAEKRVKTGLVLAAIAQAEKIEVPENELEQEVKNLLAQQPKTDPTRARAYLAGLMINERVFRWLEEQTQKDPSK
ncbi:MAG TPA: trigger factor [Candidatus Paceibacterota bacterium]